MKVGSWLCPSDLFLRYVKENDLSRKAVAIRHEHTLLSNSFLNLLQVFLIASVLSLQNWSQARPSLHLFVNGWKSTSLNTFKYWGVTQASLRPHLSLPFYHVFTLHLFFFQVVWERGQDGVGISAFPSLFPEWFHLPSHFPKHFHKNDIKYLSLYVGNFIIENYDLTAKPADWFFKFVRLVEVPATCPITSLCHFIIINRLSLSEGPRLVFRFVR